MIPCESETYARVSGSITSASISQKSALPRAINQITVRIVLDVPVLGNKGTIFQMRGFLEALPLTAGSDIVQIVEVCTKFVQTHLHGVAWQGKQTRTSVVMSDLY